MVPASPRDDRRTSLALKSVGLACGPTGGHLLPARLIAEKLLGHSIHPVIFTSRNDLSDKLLSNDILQTDIQVKPWAGAGPLGKLFSIVTIVLEYGRLRHRFRRLDGLVSLGGHTALPPLLGARERSIPTFIQEQNTVPGRANRLFVSGALEVFLGFPSTDRNFQIKGSVTGNPVRPAKDPGDPWFRKNPLLVVLGGSQGSRQLSDILVDNAPNLLDRNWLIYYVRGTNGRDLMTRSWAPRDSFRQVEFETEMNRILPLADCVWSRAGAGTLSEIIQYEIPALLFPYPYAADDHQRKNAEWVSGRGPSRVVEPGASVASTKLLSLTEEIASEPTSYDVPWNQNELPQERIARGIRKWI